MNSTIDPPPRPDAPPPPPRGPDSGPDRDRFTTLASATRSTQHRMIAGVATGVARHLRIDPIIVRVVLAVLVFVGGAGLILYAAGWFLLPSDDGRRSVAADWFRLGDNEPQVRTIGLVVAFAVAIAAVVGDTGWWWGFPGTWGLIWLGILGLGIYWVVAVLPRRHREGRPPAATVPPPPPTAVVPPVQVAPRRRTPPLLFLATLCAAAATLGGLGLGAELLDRDVDGLVFVAVALLVTGLGLVAGAWWGRSWALAPIGLALAGVLAVGSALPVFEIGESTPTPTRAADVADEYRFGVGELRLDLTDVENPEALLGRTVRLEHGIGQTTVVVPDDLAVSVDAQVTGEIIIFDRRHSGHEAELTERPDAGPSLHLDIDQTFGQITVERP